MDLSESGQQQAIVARLSPLSAGDQQQDERPVDHDHPEPRTQRGRRNLHLQQQQQPQPHHLRGSKHSCHHHRGRQLSMRLLLLLAALAASALAATSHEAQQQQPMNQNSNSEDQNSSNSNNMGAHLAQWSPRQQLAVALMQAALQRAALLGERAASVPNHHKVHHQLQLHHQQAASSPTTDSFGSRLATDFASPEGEQEEAAGDHQFLNRQGQLTPRMQPRPPQPPQQPPQQPQRPPPQMVRQQQQQQQRPQQPLQQELPQPRFQRLRVPEPNLQQSNFRNQQQPAQFQAAGAPTLSAFDLSSLANLANQQAGGQQQPQFSQQVGAQPMRRQQQQQQQPSQQARGQQVPTQGNSAQTELPFVRQVFRPSASPEAASSDAEQDRPSGGRPTPPPLFVPARPLLPKRVVEAAGGFTPLQMPAQQQQPQQQQPPVSASNGREVFFEPPRQATAGQQQQRRPLLPAVQAPPQNMRRLVGPNQPQQQPQQPQVALRRPSQRPVLPAVQVPSLAGFQQQQPPTTAAVTQQDSPNRQTDVIRLASSAIQAANEGLAAISAAISANQAPSTTTTTTTSATASATTAQPTDGPTTPSSSSNSISQFQATDATTSALPTSTQATTEPEPSAGASRRAALPIRTSANFFTSAATASTAAASSQSAFSPALPINAAVAASGGRRRIPVRAGAASSRLPATTTTAAATTTTQPPQRAATTTAAAATTTSPLTTTMTAATSTTGSVRRPEIEEFYETITGGLNAATNIDGFGAPTRAAATTSTSQQPTSTTLTTTTTTTTTAATSEPSPSGNDLYGSRLASSSSPQPVDRPVERPQQEAQPQQPSEEQQVASAPPVLVPVTYMTTLTYLTTVLHGTHTLETSHESTASSTELATLNAQLMDQIEHRLPLIRPTQTVGLSSRTKGKGTTIVNLKSAVSAFNQELVDALAAGNGGGPISATAQSQPPVAAIQASSVQEMPTASQQPPRPRAQRPLVRASRTLDADELAEARKSLVTELVYLYTVRPMDPQAGQLASTTSLRSELPGVSLGQQELMGRLAQQQQQQQQQGGHQQAQLIDSRGLLRLSGVGGQSDAALNLGTTMGRDQQQVTEVQLMANSYIKFDDIANVMVELKPSQLASLASQPPSPPSDQPEGRRRQPALDASFDPLHLSLAGALDRLAAASGQQTPPLDSIGAAASPTLRPASSAAASSSRSQLRSRVASSRFRSPPPLAASPTVATPAQVAPSSVRQQRPIKSRIVRPAAGGNNGQRRESSPPAPEGLGLASLAAPVDQVAPSSSSPPSTAAAPSVRSSKPRFVVVTRTGQFGIRASAVSSASSPSSASAAPAEPEVAPSVSASPPVSVRVSSRFSKPHRFRGSASSPVLNRLESTAVPEVAPPTTSAAATTTTTTTTSTTPAPPVSSAAEGATTGTGQQEPAAGTNVGPAPVGGLQLEGSGSVVVTYFTTTTHTIPFTINSDTIFTTIEETNSRVATEFVRDLGSHFIEPTPTLLPNPATSATPTAEVSSMAPATTTTATSTTAAASSEQPATEAKLPGTITITTQEQQQQQASSPSPPEVQQQQQQQQPQPQIEPSFVVSLNTRTYLTTFTYFTTYSAQEAGQTPTVQSSESTTSSVVVETVTSVAPTAMASIDTRIEPTPTAASQPEQTVSPSGNGNEWAGPKTVATTTTTSLPTTTRANTSNEDTTTTTSRPRLESASSETSTNAKPADLSLEQQQPTTSTSEKPAEVAAAPKVETTSVVEQVAPTSLAASDAAAPQQVDRVTRTRSLYTTLTHYITFYSGTKTQLSTIQEVSPTVVTEYIDRTLFEQQLQSSTQLEARQRESSQVLVVPTLSQSDSQILMTPSPVLPPVTVQATQTAATSEASSPPPQQQTTTTTTTTTTQASSSSSSSSETSERQPEVDSAADGGNNGATAEAKTNIIELSDLIASNSSQSGRVALAGNLGAAIKDIVQLLAGNKTAQTLQPSFEVAPNASSEPTTAPPATTTTAAATSPTTSSTTSTTAAATAATPPRRLSPSGGRLFGQKAREQQQQQQLQASAIFPEPNMAAASSARTPELPAASLPTGSQQQQQEAPRAAATIFFGDDGGDERRKQVKTVWPQSTVLVTSVEPSTRSLLLTTTKVYYTRDSPITVTSSYTSLLAPRTFVSTIVGTRTLVSQLGVTTTTTSSPTPSQMMSAAPVQASGKLPPVSALPSRQEGQAAGHRLALEQKEQKKLQQQRPPVSKPANKPLVATAARPAATGAPVLANGDQTATCQPACRASLNEVCRQGVCACRPGHQWAVTRAGQRQCQEVQSYVVLLRLLQVGDQQVAYSRRLQDPNSPEFRQYARLINDQVKRAYLGSELTRDRFAGAEVVNFARSLALQTALASQSAVPRPTGGRAPIALNASQLDPLNAGVIVNITVHLHHQAPSGDSGALASEPLGEAALKEELAKRLSLRQAAALAAAAASGSQPQAPSVPPPPVEPSASGDDAVVSPQQPPEQVDPQAEQLPNPNALFLADVEQVSDLDECASPQLNDCHEGAVCINEPGSYRCDCRHYPDLNPLQPGRQCANELKSCDHCNNRGDCLRVPTSAAAHYNTSSSSGPTTRAQFSTICQCHRFYLGRRCEINGFLLACLLPILAILLFISICLVIYCCRRWRKRSALSKGFRNIGTFGPNMIGGTLDRKAMLESSSESSDTHQRSHHLRGATNAIYDTNPSEPPSSSNESSPRQMARNQAGQAVDGYHLSSAAAHQQQPQQPYCGSIPPQIVIPRARHNQVNYAVHRGQVYMW